MLETRRGGHGGACGVHIWTHLLVQHVAAARAALPAGLAALERDGGPSQQREDDGLHRPPSCSIASYVRGLQRETMAGAGLPLSHAVLVAEQLEYHTKRREGLMF